MSQTESDPQPSLGKLDSSGEGAEAEALQSYRPLRGVVYLLFAISGASGLIYQVIWVRLFGHIFGNTVHSAALVMGVFMTGLGLGSLVAGRWIDRQSDPARPLRAYAVAEILIAAAGVLLAVGLPELSTVIAEATTYVPGANGWFFPSSGAYATRYAVAVVLLVVPTFLMGATLPLLVRFVVAGEVSHAGLRVGVLYGINTLGAAAGAFFTDYTLIPAFGVLQSQLLAAGLNGIAGLGAFALARKVTASPDSVEPPIPDSGKRLPATALALFLSGFAAMGVEMVWFRLYGSALGAFRSVFSQLLTVVLIGIWLGSWLGGRLHARYGCASILYMIGQALFAGTVLICAMVLPGQTISGLPFFLVGTLVPATFMGFSFPLANAHVQRSAEAVGTRAGILYLANTLGNLAGSLTAGFVLIAVLGSQRSLATFAACAILGVIVLYLSLPERGEREQRALLASVVFFAIAAGSFTTLPDYAFLRIERHLRYPGERLLAVREGVNDTIVVTERPGVERMLHTNGHPMSGTHVMPQRYMRAFAHVPLLHLDSPKSVLVICFGVGNTAHAASLHPSVQTVAVADLSRDVLDHASFFEESNGAILKNEKVKVFVNDGRHHLLTQAPGSYDLVTLEPPPITHAGVTSLYSREFYEIARSRLSEGGFVTQWLPAYQASERSVLELVRAFVDVFPEAVLINPYRQELVLLGSNKAIKLDPAAFERRLAERGAVRADMEKVRMGNLLEIAGMFAGDAETLISATRAVPPLTDNHPLLEYDDLDPRGPRRLPAKLFDTSRVASWCPRCSAEVPELTGYLKVLQDLYASEQYLSTEINAPLSLPTDTPEAVAAVAASPYLVRMIPNRRAAMARGRRLLNESAYGEAIDTIGLAVELDPKDAAARTLLGEAFLLAGVPRGAIWHLERAVALDPNAAAARTLLEQARTSTATAPR